MSREKGEMIMSTTLAQKVDQASKYVLIPNATLTDTPDKTIWNCLEQLGIMDDDVSYELLMSSDTREGDARHEFCDKAGIPVPRFKRIWTILKEGGKEETTVSATPSSSTSELKEVLDVMRPVGQLSNKELLTRYKDNPDDSAVEKELVDRSKGGNCIAFLKEEIDVDVSASLLAKAKRGIKVPTVLNKDGKIYRVRPVGKFPNETYDICPVTGAVLFDGYSEELGVTWEVPIEARQFVWLMNDQGIRIDAFVANNIQTLYKDKGLDGLKLQYSKIAALFDDLLDVGELPTLKTNLSTKESKRLDPFRGNRRI